MIRHPFRNSLLLSATLMLAGFGTAALASIRTVPPDRLGSYWIWTSSASEVHVPNHGQNLYKPGCASASYTIGSDGVPRNIKLEKVVPSSDLGPAVVEAVRNFRYRAGPDNPGQQPVRTWYTAQFNMRNLPQAQKDKLTAACDLPGY